MSGAESPTSSRIALVLLIVVEQITIFIVTYLLHATVADYDVTLETLYSKGALLAPLGASGLLVTLCKLSGFIFVLAVLLFQLAPVIWIKLKKNHVPNKLQVLLFCSIMQLAVSVGLLGLVVSSVVFSQHGY